MLFRIFLLTTAVTAMAASLPGRPPQEVSPNGTTVIDTWDTSSCIPIRIACVSLNGCVLAFESQQVFCNAAADTTKMISPGQTADLGAVPLPGRVFQASTFGVDFGGFYSLSVPANAKSCNLRIATYGNSSEVSLACDYDQATSAAAAGFMGSGTNIRKADKGREHSKPDENQQVGSATTASQGDQQQRDPAKQDEAKNNAAAAGQGGQERKLQP